MTRTITLIVGIAVAALVFVPTALAEGRLAGSQELSGVAYFYANERATLVDQPVVGVVSRPDSHETATPFTYQDAGERASRISTDPDSRRRGPLGRGPARASSRSRRPLRSRAPARGATSRGRSSGSVWASASSWRSG